ncbi:MAG: SDR family oxidoreductase [Anaerolineae bacterium]|nr:SDR family oxidoreductase [Anaerolineae bacterium]
MSKTLIVGASGQVGEHIQRALTARGGSAVGTYRAHARPDMLRLDLCDPASIRDVLADVKPRTIVIPASLTNVDYVEAHPDEGYATNVAGLKSMINAANAIQAKLVYFSSDYIFDGRAGPYTEDDPANPINEYGRQKLAAEHLIALCAPQALIIRTTVVYGWESQGKNFVNRLIRTLGDQQPMRVPVDQVGSPTHAPDLARAVLDLVDQGASGVYNVVGRELASRYDFAVEAARAFDLDADLIQPVETHEFGQIAARPLQAGMLVSKVETALNRQMPGYAAGLRAMLEAQNDVR